MSILKVDTINEKTSGNGVEIAHALKGSGIAGHVKQVQINGSSGYTVMTSTTMTDALTCSITPSSTSSKILVMMNLNGITVGNNSAWMKLELYRDSTLIRNVSGICGYSVSHIHYNTDLSYNFLDDAVSTTSAVTYRLKYGASGSSVSVAFNNYGASNNTTSSAMTLMEIAG